MAGGSKFDLLAQLSDIGRYVSEHERTPFKLSVRQSGSRSVELYTLIHGAVSLDSGTLNGGQGDLWRIEGKIRLDTSHRHDWLREILGNFGFFAAQYSTKNRQGHLWQWS